MPSPRLLLVMNVWRRGKRVMSEEVMTEGLNRVLSPRSVNGCVGRHRERHYLCLPLERPCQVVWEVGIHVQHPQPYVVLEAPVSSNIPPSRWIRSCLPTTIMFLYLTSRIVRYPSFALYTRLLTNSLISFYLHKLHRRLSLSRLRLI